jgi:hypothetical protein
VQTKTREVLPIQDVMYVPSMSKTLLSVRQLVEYDGCTVWFAPSGSGIYTRDGRFIPVEKHNRHYVLPFRVVDYGGVCAASDTTGASSKADKAVTLVAHKFKPGDNVKVAASYFKVGKGAMPIDGYFHGTVKSTYTNGPDGAYRYKVYFPVDRKSPVIREPDLEPESRVWSDGPLHLLVRYLPFHPQSRQRLLRLQLLLLLDCLRLLLFLVVIHSLLPTVNFCVTLSSAMTV